MSKTNFTIKDYFTEVRKKLSELNSLFGSTQLTYENRTQYEGLISGKISFINDKELHILEYVHVEGNEIKQLIYRFHLQKKSNELIARWDNAPHHSQLKTFPHHEHTSQNKVKESKGMTLIDVNWKYLNHLEIVDKKAKCGQ